MPAEKTINTQTLQEKSADESQTAPICKLCELAFSLDDALPCQDSISDQKCPVCLRGLRICKSCGFLGKRTRMRICKTKNCMDYYHISCIATSTCANIPKSNIEKEPSSNARVHNEELKARHCNGAAKLRQQVADINYLGHEPDMRYIFHSRNIIMKRWLSVGDIVSLLHLPGESAQRRAQDDDRVCNRWGIVIATKPAAKFTQALLVQIFEDNSRKTLTNLKVLPIDRQREYACESDMLRACLKWHADTECRLCFSEEPEPSAEKVDELLRKCCATFGAKLKELSISMTDAILYANKGYLSYRASLADANMPHFDLLKAPSFAYLNPRCASYQQRSKNLKRNADSPADSASLRAIKELCGLEGPTNLLAKPFKPAPDPSIRIIHRVISKRRKKRELKNLSESTRINSSHPKFRRQLVPQAYMNTLEKCVRSFFLAKSHNHTRNHEFQDQDKQQVIETSDSPSAYKPLYARNLSLGPVPLRSSSILAAASKAFCPAHTDLKHSAYQTRTAHWPFSSTSHS